MTCLQTNHELAICAKKVSDNRANEEEAYLHNDHEIVSVEFPTIIAQDDDQVHDVKNQDHDHANEEDKKCLQISKKK